MQYGRQLKELWNLSPDITFLNHGSFGATPKVVIDAVSRYMNEMEVEPVSFFLDRYNKDIRRTASILSSFIGTKQKNIGFVDNASTAFNSVMNSIAHTFRPGDEIAIFNETYPAVKNTVKYYAEVHNLRINEIPMPYPVESSDDIIDAFRNKLNPWTKLAVIDHISYASAVILPVKTLISACKANGTLCFVDGAHAPGMLDINLDSLNPDWYTGNCHKWMYAPKGCAFLWCNEKHLETTHPAVISLNYKKGFTQEFDWQGTKNPSVWLALNEAIEFYKSLGENYLKTYTHTLVLQARHLLCDKMNLLLTCPDDMIGSMSSFIYPKKMTLSEDLPNTLRKKMFEQHKIELPFIIIGDKLCFRISAQVYNDLHDIERLASALEKFDLA